MLRLIVTALALLAVAPSAASAVVGGRPTSMPYIAGMTGCAGALVAPDRIVTAAQCVEGNAPTSMGWQVGPGHARTGRRVKATGVSTHPDWTPRHSRRRSRENDIAVVRISPPVTDVVPVLLAGAAPAPATPALVAGWGATRYDGAPSNVPLEADVSVVASAECARSFSPLPRATVCVKGTGVSPCQGDTGGPLIVAGQVAGVFSFMERCGTRGDAAGYTDVTAHRAFLDDPTWAPIPRGRPRIKRSKTKLTCVARFSGKVDRVRYLWFDPEAGNRNPVAVPTSRSAVRRITRADRRKRWSCQAMADNAGGYVRTLESFPVRVARA